jgi:hypothetical protein
VRPTVAKAANNTNARKSGDPIVAISLLPRVKRAKSVALRLSHGAVIGGPRIVAESDLLISLTSVTGN